MKRIAPVVFAVLLIAVCLIALGGCSSADGVPGMLVARVNGSNINITASPDDATLASYSGQELYLFALAPGEADDDLNSHIPVRSAKSGTNVTYTLPLTENGVNRLCYGFRVAFFNDVTNKYVSACGNTGYISNPEALAENKAEYPEYSSIKGLSAKYPEDALDLGISHTVIDIPVERYLVATESADALGVVCNGVSHYIDAEAVGELDEKVRLYNENNVNIYFRIVLNTAKTELPAGLRYLAFEGTVAGSPHYAINMNDAECAGHIEALIDFLAARYASKDGGHGFVGSYILGYAANSYKTAENAGSAAESEYKSSYSALVRMTYNRLLSYYKNGRVYISADSNWNAAAPGGIAGSDFLSWFATNAEQGGDYFWNIALSVTSSVLDGRLWYDNAGNGSYLTFRNYSSLTGLLNSDLYLYGDEVRRVSVASFSAPLSDNQAAQANQEASFAYVYYRTVENGRIESLIYSSQTDGDKTDGLMSVGADGLPAEKRRIYDVFSIIDSPAGNIRDAVAATIQADEWKTLYDSFSATVQRGRTTATGDTVIEPPDYEALNEKYDTSQLFDFSKGDLYGFFATGNGSFAGLDRVNAAEGSYLEASLVNKSAANSGRLVREDLPVGNISGDYLLVTFSASSLTEADVTEKFNITLTLSRTGNGKVFYESRKIEVDPGVKTTLAFKVTDFTSAKGDGDVRMTLSSVGDGNASCKLKVYSIMSAREKGNTVLIVLLVILGTAALIAIVGLLVFWFNKRYKIEVGPSSKGKTAKRQTKPQTAVKKPEAAETKGKDAK